MISVVIPAKREEATIEKIVNSVRDYCDEVIVVVSSDDLLTIQNIPSFARIVFENNPGKGEALRAGSSQALGNILVFIDADLSHDPNDIQYLITPIIDGNADHVVASRMLGGSSELFYTFPQFIRLCGSHLITLCINHKFNVRLTDSQNGFRAIRKDLFQAISTQEKHTTIEQELTVKTLIRGNILLEIRSHEYARYAGNSKIVVFRDGWRYLFYLIKFMIFTRKKFTSRLLANPNHKYNKRWFE